jgi:hypothetical protein
MDRVALFEDLKFCGWKQNPITNKWAREEQAYIPSKKVQYIEHSHIHKIK